MTRCKLTRLLQLIIFIIVWMVLAEVARDRFADQRKVYPTTQRTATRKAVIVQATRPKPPALSPPAPIKHTLTYHYTTTNTTTSPTSTNPASVKVHGGVNSTSNKYYVMTMLGIFGGKVWEGYDNFSLADLDKRDQDYIDTLKHNLNHPLVQQIHLFYTEERTFQIARDFKLKNWHKVQPVHWYRRLHMVDFFTYASVRLLNKTVIAMNSDIMIGEGFEKVDTERLRDEKVMFSLTRHAYNSSKNNCSITAVCSRLYQGSHDTHVFRLAEPLNSHLLKQYLNYPINMWGAENGLMFVFRAKFKFVVKNPCGVLYTYHRHCSDVHGPRYEKIAESKYHIKYRGWTREQVLYSRAFFEDTLTYGNSDLDPVRVTRGRFTDGPLPMAG